MRCLYFSRWAWYKTEREGSTHLSFLQAYHASRFENAEIRAFEGLPSYDDNMGNGGPGSRLCGARTKPNRQRGGSFLCNKKPMLIALPPGVQHGFSEIGLGISHPIHLPFLHFNPHSSSQFRFFWPSEAPGCVFLRQAINSSPKKINALKRKLGAFLAK